MSWLQKNLNVYVYNKAIDMRYSFERLSYLIRQELGHDIDLGDMYLFLGQNRKRLKILVYDGSGLVLITKRLEKKSFMSILDLNRFEITMSDLEYIAHGSRLKKYLPKSKVS